MEPGEVEKKVSILGRKLVGIGLADPRDEIACSGPTSHRRGPSRECLRVEPLTGEIAELEATASKQIRLGEPAESQRKRENKSAQCSRRFHGRTPWSCESRVASRQTAPMGALEF